MAKTKVPSFALDKDEAWKVFHSQYLHELFWIDLIKSSIAEFRFHIESRVASIELYVPKLDLYIENSGVDYEEVGGWVMTETKLELEGAVRAITQGMDLDENFDDILGPTFESTYSTMLAYLSEYADSGMTLFGEKYGVTLTEAAEDVIIPHAAQWHDGNEWETGTAVLHPRFKQVHSWGALKVAEQKEIIEFLLWAAKSKFPSEYPKLSAQDFLICIALHPKSTKAHLTAISVNKDKTLQKIVKARS